MGSPSLQNRPFVHMSGTGRITGPQPVDVSYLVQYLNVKMMGQFQDEKQHQLQLQKEQYYRLMIEKEQRYVDLLRSQIALSPDEKKYLELEKCERNLQKLQGMLKGHNKNQAEVSETYNFFYLLV